MKMTSRWYRYSDADSSRQRRLFPRPFLKIFLSLCTEYSEMDSLLQTELNDIPQARLYHFSRPFLMIFWGGKRENKIKKLFHAETFVS